MPCSTNYFISRDSLSHYAVCKTLAVAKRQHNGVGKVLLEESKLKFCLCRGGRAINLLIFKRSLHGNVLPSTGKKKKRLCSRGWKQGSWLQWLNTPYILVLCSWHKLCDAQNWNQKVLAREKWTEGTAGNGQLQVIMGRTLVRMQGPLSRPLFFSSRLAAQKKVKFSFARVLQEWDLVCPLTQGFGEERMCCRTGSSVSPSLEVWIKWAGEGTDSLKRGWRCKRGPCSEILQVSHFPLHALHLRGKKYPHAYIPSTNLVLL